MPIKDQHIRPDRGEDRGEIIDRMYKTHKERELAASRANPNFKKYMKDRRAAHEATKRSA